MLSGVVCPGEAKSVPILRSCEVAAAHPLERRKGVCASRETYVRYRWQIAGGIKKEEEEGVWLLPHQQCSCLGAALKAL